MDETKARESAYSSEHTATTVIGSLPGTVVTHSSWTRSGAEFWERTQYRPKIDLLKSLRAGQWPSLAEFNEFAKRTRRVWLTAGVAVIGLVAAANLRARVAEWARTTREKRQEQAVATVTPEHLIARCGQAAEDVTKEVYPIMMRTIIYQPRYGDKIVFVFSRTMETKSDWVFLSMQDENRASGYDTAEAKIAALPCLDSKK